MNRNTKVFKPIAQQRAGQTFRGRLEQINGNSMQSDITRTSNLQGGSSYEITKLPRLNDYASKGFAVQSTQTSPDIAELPGYQPELKNSVHQLRSGAEMSLHAKKSMFKKTKLSLPLGKDQGYLESLKAWSLEKEELSHIGFFQAALPTTTKKDQLTIKYVPEQEQS